MKTPLSIILILSMALTVASCTPANTVDPSLTEGSDKTNEASQYENHEKNPETVNSPDTSAPESADTGRLTDVPETTDADSSSELTDSQQSDPEITDAPIAERPTEYYNRDTVYLTFDDGPGQYTEKVLEILDNYDVKATFFVVGTQVKRYPDELKMIADAGHSIGAHSMSHEYRKIYASADTIKEDLLLWEAAVTDAIGYVPAERLYRFPGGSTCTAIEEGMFPVLRDALLEMDYRSFDWTFSNNDAYFKDKREDQTMVDYLKESSVATLRPSMARKIMLMHEINKNTVEMLPWLIEYLQSEGYKIEPLTYASDAYTFAK